MNILALETSSTSGSVAVSRNGRLTAMSYLDIRLTHSERLLPQVEWVLQQSDLVIADLDAITVSNGPGSFTGLRIGLAAAKGFCLARSIPLIPLSTADIVAYGLLGADSDILVLLDAKMGELHAALYSPFMQSLQPLCLTTVAEVLTTQNRPLVVVGEGVDRYRNEIITSGVPWRIAEPRLHHPSASVMLDMVEKMEIPPYEFDTVSALEPYYLRRSQAEVVKEKRDEMQSRGE
jgi:tRNA threonylcarbamoyladenosine biosynthesis protein TsaB